VDSCDETVTNDDDTPHETLALLAQRILEYLNYSRAFAILIYPNDGMKRVGSSWNFGFCSLRYWRRALRADAYLLSMMYPQVYSNSTPCSDMSLRLINHCGVRCSRFRPWIHTVCISRRGPRVVSSWLDWGSCLTIGRAAKRCSALLFYLVSPTIP
jgi:hypothetical protein